MIPPYRALTPLAFLSVVSLWLALPVNAPAQTASPASPGAGATPPSNPDTPADRNAKAANPANTGTTAGSGATQTLMQRMRQECGSVSDPTARSACEDRYRRQMEEAAGTGNLPGETEHDRQQPGKPR